MPAWYLILAASLAAQRLWELRISAPRPDGTEPVRESRARKARVPAWYLVLAASLAAQRLWELRISARHESRSAGSRAAAGAFPAMVGLHAALVSLPPVEVALAARRSGRGPRARLPWIAALAAAAALRRWSIRSLGDAWNVRALVPADLRPVTGGPYRWVRHPNYLAVTVEFLALPLAAGAWRSAALLSAGNALLLARRVREEEALLAAVPGYREAFGGRARFIPGIF